MTPIQRAALPHALVGHDILGAAKTGTLVHCTLVVINNQQVLEKLLLLLFLYSNCYIESTGMLWMDLEPLFLHQHVSWLEFSFQFLML